MTAQHRAGRINKSAPQQIALPAPSTERGCHLRSTITLLTLTAFTGITTGLTGYFVVHDTRTIIDRCTIDGSTNGYLCQAATIATFLSKFQLSVVAAMVALQFVVFLMITVQSCVDCYAHKTRHKQQIALPATARAKILAELAAARTDATVNDDQLAANIIRAISEELGIYEDVYDQLSEAIEPYVSGSPPDSNCTNPCELPGSVVDAMNVLLAHWVAKKNETSATLLLGFCRRCGRGRIQQRARCGALSVRRRRRGVDQCGHA